MKQQRPSPSLKRLPFYFALLLLASSCTSYVPVAGGDNFAYLYGKGAAAIRLDARVYHESAKRSVIWFKLRTEDLLYKSSGGGGPFRAKVLLKYEAFADLSSNVLLDSASTWVKDESAQPTQEKELIGSMDMKRNDKAAFVIRVTAYDLNRDASSAVYIHIDQGASGGRQCFLPVDDKGLPWFTDHMTPGTAVRVLCEQYAGATLMAAHYTVPEKLPSPVFSDALSAHPEPQKDSVFSVHVNEDGWFLITTPASGFYHFKADTATEAGYSLFASRITWPTVRNGNDMVPPLRYITSTQEWEKLTGSLNKRQEVERFWLDAAGERERAREAIEAYYTRVENANRHFTGTLEGWRTDRGLVHIIFGTPNTIRKSAQGETWTYGEENNLMSLTFTFVRHDSPFSDNDLLLQRDPMFKSAWYRNVESWRNGRTVQN